MDKSELFIKQCDCLEVQGQKQQFETGDWFAYYDPKAKGKRGELIIAVVGADYYPFDREGVKKYSNLSVVGFDEGEGSLVWEAKIIWLPMQHQIQGMMGFKYPGPGYIRKLWDFTLDESEARAYDSFEQLWLAFYFYEKHLKTWDSEKEKWVKR